MRKITRFSVLFLLALILQLLMIGCNQNDETTISFDDSAITVKGAGATASGSVVTITASGSYRVKGTLNDGQLIIDCPSGKAVYLYLDNMSITCTTDAPIIVKQCPMTVICTENGTQNIITDNHTYKDLLDNSDAENVFSENADAAIYSKDPLFFKGNGTGKLVINGNAHNGISSSDTLTIEGGNITVDAANNALKGKDYVVISGGNLNLKADNYVIKSTNTKDSSLGYINISGGNLTLHSGDDGLYAPNSINVSGSNLTMKSKHIAFKTEGTVNLTSGIIDLTTDDQIISAATKNIGSGVLITVNGSAYKPE